MTSIGSKTVVTYMADVTDSERWKPGGCSQTEVGSLEGERHLPMK